MKDASLLVLANKQDLPDALTSNELRDRLMLDCIKNKTGIKILKKYIKWEKN